MISSLKSVLLVWFNINCITGYSLLVGNRNIVNQWRRSKSNDIQMVSLDSVLPTIASLSAVAGVTAFHEAGHFLAAKVQNITIQSFNVGYGPKLLAFNDSNQIEYAFRLIPLGGYVAFPANVITDDNGEIIGENTEDLNLLQNRPPLQRAIVISGGVIANILLTFLITSGLSISPGLPRPVFDRGIVVNSRVTDSPGTLAGIQLNDVITRIGDYEVIPSATSVPDFVQRVQNTPPGELVQIELQRPIGPSAATGTGSPLSKPTQTVRLQIDPTRSLSGKATIGIGVGPNVISNQIVRASSLIEAAQIGARETSTLIKTVSSGLYAAASSGFTGSDVGGPISVIKAGANAAQYDPILILGFASFLSINLAILNSLPLPALDGGQLLFVLIELLSGGRKIPREIQTGLIGVAFSFLLFVSAGTFVNDLSHLNDPTPPQFRIKEKIKAE